MIYCSHNFNSIVALHNIIKSEIDKNCILKNNFIYTKHDISEFNNHKTFIKRYDDYLFYLLNGHIDILSDIKINLQEFNVSNQLNFELYGEFNFIENGFFSNGNCVVLYFSTPHTSNPLDILYSINAGLVLSNDYFDITTDYLIYRDKIIYYILFRYSLMLEPNLSEIVYNKNNILNCFKLHTPQNRNEIFLREQIFFEDKYLFNFPELGSEAYVNYEGLSIHSPINVSSERTIYFNE